MRFYTSQSTKQTVHIEKLFLQFRDIWERWNFIFFLSNYCYILFNINFGSNFVNSENRGWTVYMFQVYITYPVLSVKYCSQMFSHQSTRVVVKTTWRPRREGWWGLEGFIQQDAWEPPTSKLFSLQYRREYELKNVDGRFSHRSFAKVRPSRSTKPFSAGWLVYLV